MEGDPESQSSTKKSEPWACLSPPALSWDFCRSLQQGPSVAPAFLRGLGCPFLVDTYSSSSSLSAGGASSSDLGKPPQEAGARHLSPSLLLLNTFPFASIGVSL